MNTIKQVALGFLAAELMLAALLVVGLMVPLPGRVEFKIVQSGSMEPALPVGSVVVIVPQERYGVGDIITFGDDTAKRIPTTHRVHALEPEAGKATYVTKGDANEEADNTRTSYGEVIGKVVLSVPRLGYVLDFARSKNGFTFMVVIPAALIILDEVLSIVGTLRGARRRKEDEQKEKLHNEKRSVPQRPHEHLVPVRQARRTAPLFVSMDGLIAPRRQNQYA